MIKWVREIFTYLFSIAKEAKIQNLYFTIPGIVGIKIKTLGLFFKFDLVQELSVSVQIELDALEIEFWMQYRER